MVKKYFGTDGIRGLVGGPCMNIDFITRLGRAVASRLLNDNHPTIYIGHDTRESSEALVNAFAQGAADVGVNVGLLGCVPTPAVAHLVCCDGVSLGVVVSASHNPYCDNGIKLFSQAGFKLSDKEEEAIEEAITGEIPSAVQPGDIVTLKNSAERYGKFCLQTTGIESLSTLRVVMDAANGALHAIASNVFNSLSATVVNIADQPNGKNINEQCGAVHPELLQQKVLDCQADVGVAFDGDGDRLIMVDADGQLVDGDQILYALAMSRLPKIAAQGVVGTLMTNLGFEQAMINNNIPFVRAKVGDRYVLELLREKQWSLGGEASGHLIDLKHATTGDALLAVLQVCQLMQQQSCSLSDLVVGMKKYPQVLINVPISERFALDAPQLQQGIQQAELVLADSGRVLVRQSGTEPLVRVMVEGQELELVNSLAKQLADIIEAL